MYAKYLDQVLRLEKAGGASTLPAEMQVLVTGQYEKDVQEAYSKLAKLGTKAEAGSRYRIISLRKSARSKDAEIAIRACVDAREVILLDRNGKRSGRGTLRQDDLYFVRIGTRLAIAEGDSVRVETCEK
ncbi:hypothetical protein [Acidipropionibacterium virtanenii]|uniref:hypothetical protein n=1 Tax=Acidipropionibacterium virtanenii TaxID=2057246 RepID=UPI0011BF2036|nr:hypothetical protein [Acidipropionibacterium virtanenii]